jgi:outer membrane lipoprotein SlyB
MSWTKNLSAIVAILSLTACAGANYRPMIDTRNVDMNKYEADLRDCQQYAQGAADAGTGAAVGAGVGAVLGFALAAISGSRYDRGASAGVGALTGGVAGGAQAERGQHNVVKRCISGRGYSVLQ